MSKKCNTCGETKELNEFHKRNSKSDARRPECKSCHKACCRKNHRRYTLESAPDKPTYLITDGEFLKVGVYKGSLKTRLQGLQNGNPRKLKVLATSESNIEKLCHYEFEHLNVLNEWFKFDLKLITFFTENAV